ncbi:hypothetical protein ABZ612_40760 [Streptomyces avermitilis]|uniref:hypothetical protein n=1 Tax=Streptomyces avermitilis TaxID=33903 RepID=UPI003401D2A4
MLLITADRWAGWLLGRFVAFDLVIFRFAARRPDEVAVTAMTRSAVELGHQLTVCGAGGFDVLVPFSEFAAKVENLLFQVGGAACERLDVGRGAEAGGFPSCLSQGLGQAPFEPGDVRGQLPVAGREVRDVGQQRLAADLRSGSRAGRRAGPRGR